MVVEGDEAAVDTRSVQGTPSQLHKIINVRANMTIIIEMLIDFPKIWQTIFIWLPTGQVLPPKE